MSLLLQQEMYGRVSQTSTNINHLYCERNKVYWCSEPFEGIAAYINELLILLLI